MQTKIQSIFSGVHGWATVITLIAAIIQVFIPYLSPAAAGVAGTIASAVILFTHPTTTTTS